MIALQHSSERWRSVTRLRAVTKKDEGLLRIDSPRSCPSNPWAPTGRSSKSTSGRTKQKNNCHSNMCSIRSRTSRRAFFSEPGCGNDGLWKEWKNDEAVFPTLPTDLGNRCRDYHIPTATT